MPLIPNTWPTLIMAFLSCQRLQGRTVTHARSIGIQGGDHVVCHFGQPTVGGKDGSSQAKRRHTDSGPQSVEPPPQQPNHNQRRTRHTSNYRTMEKAGVGRTRPCMPLPQAAAASRACNTHTHTTTTTSQSLPSSSSGVGELACVETSHTEATTTQCHNGQLYLSKSKSTTRILDRVTFRMTLADQLVERKPLPGEAGPPIPAAEAHVVPRRDLSAVGLWKLHARPGPATF